MPSIRPKVSPLHLGRRRLLGSLPDDAGFAVWLEAPYGYGKSVLASQWAEQLEAQGWRVVWTSAGGAAPRQQVAHELDLPASAPWSVLLGALWAQPTLLVVEDLERLEDHEALSPFLRDLGGLVLLASRGPVTASELPRLLTIGRLVHVTAEQLGFSKEEAEELFENGERASDVWRRTHGWPLPLHFAHLTGELPERTSLLEGLRASLSHPEWEELLLLATLEMLPLEAALLTTEQLARSGFARHAEGGFLLHPLVGEAVLRSHGEAARTVLEREQARLSPLARAEAFERSGHLSGLARSLEAVSEQLWRLAPEAVLRWDAMVPANPSPRRHIAAGGALKVLGRNQESAQRLEAALEAGTLTPDEELLALGELCWVQALTAPAEAPATVHRGEALLDIVEPERAGRFLTNTFIVDIMGARFGAAIGKLERALEYFPPGSPYRVGARINLALARWDQDGELETRLRTQMETLPDTWRLYPSDAPGQCRDVAMLHAWLGRVAEARSYFEQARDGARHNPLVDLEVRAALAHLDADPEPFETLLSEAEAWGDAYTLEIITMHGVNTLGRVPSEARRFYERSPAKGGLAAAAHALTLAAGGAEAEATRLLDANIAQFPDRPRQLYLRAARYRVTRSPEDLEAFMGLTTAGARLLPGFVPLSELPQNRPDLAQAYPLEEVAGAGWREATMLRAAELPDLELNLLGAFQTRLFGKELRLTERQQQLMLLATLGLNREETAEVMWPEVSHEKQRNNLGVQLNSLRKLIEPWGFGTYLTEHGLERVRSDYAELKRALAERRADVALQLYTEPLAPGLTLELLEDERRQLREEVVALLFAASTGSQPEHATALLARVLELDPLHEAALQALLRLLLGKGRRHEALRRYREFQARLLEETGLAPLDETAGLVGLTT